MRRTSALDSRRSAIAAPRLVIDATRDAFDSRAGADGWGPLPAAFTNATTTTTVDLLATTNSSVLTFEPGPHHSAMLDRTEGFLLLRRPIRICHAGAGGGRGQPPPPSPLLEASFNSSFTLGGARRIAFVVLLDSISVGVVVHGAEANNHTASASSNAAIAAVQVGPVTSYYDTDYNDRDGDGVDLNVTVTPRGARALAVWIEYDAVAHRLSVFVAADNRSRTTTKPTKPLLDAPLNLAVGRRTTETAYIGFFAGMVRDVIVGVREWNLTVDKFPEESVAYGNKKGRLTPWLVVLLAVLGSVAATSSGMTGM
ncbi:hypothetical protein QOZ80_1BG0074850 [Eleusine coracana subsp. coracana]|nr:hypothetical protein QOZ80_1BG0074850 [Eleusine coracana subsp. coracana]